MSNKKTGKIQKIFAYIDGFNLYYALKDKNWQRYYWLNLWLFVENLLLTGQELRKIKYFTSFVRGTPEDPKKPYRQQAFLNAIKTLPDIEIIYGIYLYEPQLCPICQKQLFCQNCKIPIDEHTEKKTDVNIATELLIDAYLNRFDTALLISGDSDLTPAVEKTIEIFNKRVVIAFPPDRHSNLLAKVASHSFIIGRNKFAKSMFPDSFITAEGVKLTKPKKWK